MARSALLKAGSVLLVALAAAQVAGWGPRALTFPSPIDDSDQPYALYVPKDYTPSRKWPLVISLHGAGSNHRLNLRRVFGLGNRPGETDAQASRYFPVFREVEFLVASPLARGTMGYQGIAEKDVYDVLDAVKRTYNVDEERVYLTGLSMGGGGTLWLGLTRPDVWAALAPVCPAPPSEAEPLAGNALNLPVKLFQGEMDPVVPAGETREWRKRFEDERVAVEYVEYPGVRHNAWDYAYKNGAIFDWFATFRRERFPVHVRFTARDYDHASAYWVRLDSLTPGELASVDAVFSAPDTIDVQTKGLDGFTLLLAGHPLAKGRRPLAVSVDGFRIRALLAAELPFERTAKGWTARRAVLPSGSKCPGAEGPIAAALSARHVYIYGTRATEDSDEIARRRAAAEQASEWSTPRSRLMLTFAVRSDREWTAEPGEARANLVLLGTKETNSVLEQFAPSLPLHLNSGAADYGLLYVYPVPGRYIVVNSGLPWRTRADQTQRGGLPFLNPTVRLIQSFGDFILYKGGLDQVIVEGRFDRNWKLPADAVSKLRASGAVEVTQ